MQMQLYQHAKTHTLGTIERQPVRPYHELETGQFTPRLSRMLLPVAMTGGGGGERQ